MKSKGCVAQQSSLLISIAHKSTFFDNQHSAYVKYLSILKLVITKSVGSVRVTHPEGAECVTAPPSLVN